MLLPNVVHSGAAGMALQRTIIFYGGAWAQRPPMLAASRTRRRCTNQDPPPGVPSAKRLSAPRATMTLCHGGRALLTAAKAGTLRILSDLNRPSWGTKGRLNVCALQL